MMSQMYRENSLEGSGHPTPNATPLGLSWEAPHFPFPKAFTTLGMPSGHQVFSARCTRSTKAKALVVVAS